MRSVATITAATYDGDSESRQVERERETSGERREGEEADEDGSDAVAEERDRGRVAAERRRVVGDPSERRDHVEQGVVAGRRVAAVARRQEPCRSQQSLQLHVDSALHPSGVAEPSTSIGWGKGGNVTSGTLPPAAANNHCNSTPTRGH